MVNNIYIYLFIYYIFIYIYIFIFIFSIVSYLMYYYILVEWPHAFSKTGNTIVLK